MRKEPFPIVVELSPDKLTLAEEKAFELLKAEHDKTAIDSEDHVFRSLSETVNDFENL